MQRQGKKQSLWETLQPLVMTKTCERAGRRKREWNIVCSCFYQHSYFYSCSYSYSYVHYCLLSSYPPKRERHEGSGMKRKRIPVHTFTLYHPCDTGRRGKHNPHPLLPSSTSVFITTKERKTRGIRHEEDGDISLSLQSISSLCHWMGGKHNPHTPRSCTVCLHNQ